MKKVLFNLLLLFIISGAHAQLSQESYTYSNNPIHFYQYKPPTYRTGSPKNPLIISLHGAGERGDGSPTGMLSVLTGGIPKKINDNATQMVFSYYIPGSNTTVTDGFVVLAPQIPQNTVWESYLYYVDAMIQHGINDLNVDPNRIFLTGYSLGATGTWSYATGSAANAAKLAGIAPVSGQAAGGGYNNIASQKVAAWSFQGSNDDYAGNAWQVTTNAINSYNPAIPPFYTIYQGANHGAQVWDDFAYDVTNNTHEPNLYQWMLRVSRNMVDPASNQNPTAIATMQGSSDLTLYAPQSFSGLSLLTGDKSTDPDDIIIDYLWTQTGGKTVYMNANRYAPTSEQRPNTGISDPGYSNRVELGDYQFNLRVMDYLTTKPGHTQNATLKFHVILPPSGHAGAVLNAGGIHNITTSTDSQIGSWESYTCTGCGVNSWRWSLISQPAGASASLRDYNNPNNPYNNNGSFPAVAFANLNINGQYKFEFKTTNVAGDISTDILTINRTNGALPVNYAYVNATNAGDNNIVSWATTSEINSDHFDVQRSVDGLSYSTIGTVKSTGSASIITDYRFTDDNAPAGLSYYRLSQVDKDGQTALSKVVSVNNKKTGIYIERYPNPVHNSLNVTVQSITNGAIQVVIADMQGKTILQQQWQKDQQQLKKAINVAGLQNGMYQMVITIGQERKVSSFVKY